MDYLAKIKQKEEERIYLDKDHITYYLKKDVDNIDWRSQRPLRHIKTDAITRKRGE